MKKALATTALLIGGGLVLYSCSPVTVFDAVEGIAGVQNFVPNEQAFLDHMNNRWAAQWGFRMNAENEQAALAEAAIYCHNIENFGRDEARAQHARDVQAARSDLREYTRTWYAAIDAGIQWVCDL